MRAHVMQQMAEPLGQNAQPLCSQQRTGILTASAMNLTVVQMLQVGWSMADASSLRESTLQSHPACI